MRSQKVSKVPMSFQNKKNSIRLYKKELFRLQLFQALKTKKMKPRPARTCKVAYRPIGHFASSYARRRARAHGMAFARQNKYFQVHKRSGSTGLPRRTPSQRIRSLRIRSTKDLPHHGCAHHGQSTSRSSAKPCEARQPPKAAGAEGAPEPREGRKRKLGCDSTGRDSAVAYKQLLVGGKACSARTGFIL